MVDVKGMSKTIKKAGLLNVDIMNLLYSVLITMNRGDKEISRDLILYIQDNLEDVYE